ncbi:MAG: NAD-dependent epimerase/dehydratase family protein [Polyangiaceae bacterium]|nr:NAD-dependent epimerase/dehydratase family protein [Polyangiaceae bacterium]
MRCLVTGVAGFVGSHLGERLIAQGHEVVGVDCFTDYYPRTIKESNLATLRKSPAFTFLSADLARIELASVLEGVDVVYHQAAQAGVRASWGSTFESYTHHNVLATQRLLEAVKGSKSVRRFVYASSSSVYGETTDLPMRETSLPRPFSPYGVTKLAAEHLCELYRNNFGVSTVSLRYFTVYGPRQRPDMGFHKFIASMMRDEPVTVFGSGEQTRDFTFVDDIVDANIAAGEKDGVEGVYNIGGGSRVTLQHVLETMAELVGVPLKLNRIEEQAGDVHHTEADASRARDRLGYKPRVSLRDGLARQIEWARTGAAPASS